MTDPAALRNRLVIATSMWREATNDPLPRMPRRPEQQLEAFELKLVDMVCGKATPETARRWPIAPGTWCTTAPTTTPVKRRVAECHERSPASRPAPRSGRAIVGQFSRSAREPI